MIINITPKKTLLRLLGFIVFLLSANLCAIIMKYYYNHDSFFGLVPLFNFDVEQNIPTFYSAIALMLCSILLLIIALTHKKQSAPWLSWAGLAIIFLFLSIDEFASIHEGLIDPVRDTLGTSGFLYFAWVIPYGIALMLFLALYTKFLIRLPQHFAFLFILSGSIFVTGAIGLELIGGNQVESHGINNITYSLISTCEEFLEMLGIVIFIYTLLLYITTEIDGVSINIRSKEQ
ncbi:MAG: hypothetical protein QM500_13905 [Methylococcales bacterium]